MTVITSRQKKFIESGVASIICVADKHFHTQGARSWGSYLCDERETLTIFIQAEAARPVISCLQENPNYALILSKPTNYQSLQIKGKFISSFTASNKDKLLIERYISLFTQEITSMGAPFSLMDNIITSPAVGMQLTIDEIYDSTPGKVAGRRIEIE